MSDLADRKFQHLELANSSQSTELRRVEGLNYEPLFAAHPQINSDRDFSFADKKLGLPLWVSSMTGGTGAARHINQNLAKACRDFGLGMGLGSCRPLLESRQFFEDFNLRPIIGESLPFYANLGITQVENLLDQKETYKIIKMIDDLNCDGLIIHVNPLQEWFQPEGDRLKAPPYETITKLLNELQISIIVKEVGQGFGPQSMKALMKLPLTAVEFGAYGGTNFSYLEQQRRQYSSVVKNEIDKSTRGNLVRVGHTALEMTSMIRKISSSLPEEEIQCRNFIISGGVNDILEGHRLRETLLEKSSQYQAVIGQARGFLEYATEDYSKLKYYCESMRETFLMAQSFLSIKTTAVETER